MVHLDIQDVKRIFGTVRAVDGVSLSVERGEFISLLGPSGSGKTTLLRIVAGFERPDQGRILLSGNDITHVPPQRRHMGMVFQAYALFPNLTAAQNVAFGLRVRRQPSQVIEKRVAELLALVGLEGKANRYPSQLSGGEQQRVALARALAPNPEVLLLDEPLSALDARIRLNLRTEIRRIQRQLSITTLYVTHDQEEALAMSDRVVVFNSGRVEQTGRPEDIYDRPATLFVTEFVGTTNRLVAVVADRGAGLVQVDGQTFKVAGVDGDYEDGETVELRVRPERIRRTPDRDGMSSRVEGEVEDTMFLGGRMVIKVRLGGQSLFMEAARDPAEEPPEPGTAIALYIPSQVFVTRRQGAAV